MALFLSLLIPHFLSITISLYVFFAFYTFLSCSLHSHLSLLRLHSLGMAFSLSLLIPFFFSNAKSIYVFSPSIPSCLILYIPIPISTYVFHYFFFLSLSPLLGTQKFWVPLSSKTDPNLDVLGCKKRKPERGNVLIIDKSKTK